MKNKINIYLVSFTSTILRLVQNAGIIILMSHVLSFELFSNYIYGFTVFGIISLFVDAGSYNKVTIFKVC
ncbi:hypothetical protein AYY22_16070 [Photobacterium kishitanii]|nr:hypothetical protein AYY22_16070 [Photobacterium kishitanii]